MKNNRYYLEKADTVLSDIMTNGGYLQDEQAKRFLVDMINESVIMKNCNIQTLGSHTRNIPKIGLGGRVMKPGASATALTVGDRTAAITSSVEISTKLLKGEVRLDDETLEDNIEQGTLKDTIFKMVREQVANDIEEMVINGDTGSADPLLSQCDGMIKTATSHVVDAGGATLSKSHLKAGVKALPSKYARLKGQQVFLTSENVEMDYRDYLADRATVLGDKMIEGGAPLVYQGRKMLSVPMFPENLGTGTNESAVILSHMKNFIVGFWRKVRFQSDYDVQSGVWYLVPSVRVGCVWQEEDAVVKIQNVLAA